MADPFLASRVAAAVTQWLDKNATGIPLTKQSELLAQVTQAIDSPQNGCCAVAAEPVERYCVIAFEAIQRQWSDNIEDAQAHAAALFARPDNRRLRRLALVKAVSVLEPQKPVPPPVASREPRAQDFPTHD